MTQETAAVEAEKEEVEVVEQPRDDSGKFVKKEAEPVEAQATEDDEDDAAPPKPAVLVPKARYDFKAAQAKQLEKRAADLEAKLRSYEEADKKAKESPAVDYDAQIAAIDKQIADARKDGNTDAVIELMDKKTELRIAKVASAREPAQEIDTSKLTEEALDKLRVDEAITRLEEEYSVLVPDSDDYDPDVVAEIQDLRAAFEARGYSRFDALSRAVNYVLPNIESKTEKTIEAPTLSGPRKTDVKKNIDAKKRMPPDMLSVATPSDKLGMQNELPSVYKLTEAEFEALPESKKRQMRGDFFGA